MKQAESEQKQCCYTEARNSCGAYQLDGAHLNPFVQLTVAPAQLCIHLL